MADLARHFRRNKSGTTAIEYSLIAALISVAIVAVVGTIGNKMNTMYTSVSTSLGT